MPKPRSPAGESYVGISGLQCARVASCEFASFMSWSDYVHTFICGCLFSVIAECTSCVVLGYCCVLLCIAEYTSCVVRFTLLGSYVIS